MFENIEKVSINGEWFPMTFANKGEDLDKNGITTYIFVFRGNKPQFDKLNSFAENEIVSVVGLDLDDEPHQFEIELGKWSKHNNGELYKLFVSLSDVSTEENTPSFVNAIMPDDRRVFELFARFELLVNDLVKSGTLTQERGDELLNDSIHNLAGDEGIKRAEFRMAEIKDVDLAIFKE